MVKDKNIDEKQFALENISHYMEKLSIYGF